MNDNMTTWRDITDQLTPWQIRELESYEAAGSEPDALMFFARTFAADNLTGAVMFGDVPTPGDAARVFSWAEDDDGTWYRDFAVSPTHVGHVELCIHGTQYSDGSIERRIMLMSDDSDALTAADAHRLARTLIAAADELDRLS